MSDTNAMFNPSFGTDNGSSWPYVPTPTEFQQAQVESSTRSKFNTVA